MSIEIANESGTEVDEAHLAGLARHVLDGMGVHPLVELSVLLVDEATMADLHERWMGEPGPTDVLAFPMDELRPPNQAGGRADRGPAAEPDPVPGLLGDVVLCPEVAAEQAARAGHDLTGELELLCTHGILHLLGYDHADEAEHATMFGLQDKLLAQWRAEHPAGAKPSGAENPRAGNPGAEHPGAEHPGAEHPGAGGGPASGRHVPEGREGPG